VPALWLVTALDEQDRAVGDDHDAGAEDVVHTYSLARATIGHMFGLPGRSGTRR
jgi:hypothetical protein